MATYNSTGVSTSAPTIGHGLSGNLKVAYAEVVCSAAPATTDTLNFFDLPVNARIVLAVLESDDLDTNGSPTITLNIGDSGSATRLFSASTVAQAGTASTALAAGAVGYKTTAKTRIVGVPQANAATGAAGTIRLAVAYYVEGAAS
jgi:hypothetical protein